MTEIVHRVMLVCRHDCCSRASFIRCVLYVTLDTMTHVCTLQRVLKITMCVVSTSKRYTSYSSVWLHEGTSVIMFVHWHQILKMNE